VDLDIPGLTQFEEVGRGGFGVVYRAWEDRLQRHVAVKVLHARFDRNAHARFEREIRIMGSLSSHPNIVTVFSTGETSSGDTYLHMEYVASGSLAALIGSEAFGPGRVVDIGTKLSDALQAAHDAGVIHRDVKPQNVLMSEFGEPKLSDFGIARLEGAERTTSGVVTASIHYAAPEVLEGRPISPAADVYSLAATLYELLAGTPPFSSPSDESVFAVLSRVANQPVADLRPLGVPDELCRAIERAMTKDPSQRTASAELFGYELQRAVAQAPPGEEALTAAVAPNPPMAPMPPMPPPPPRPDTPGLHQAELTTDEQPDPMTARPRKRGVLGLALVAAVLVAAVGAAFAVQATLANDDGSVDARAASSEETSSTTTAPTSTTTAPTTVVEPSVTNATVTPTTSPPLPPPPTQGVPTPTIEQASFGRMIVVLGNVDHSLGYDAATAELDEVRPLVPNASILDSSAYASLRPGYWVIFFGPFDTATDVRNYCAAVLGGAGDNCYPRRLSQDPADADRQF
jgi:serine/threonine protein kinase